MMKFNGTEINLNVIYKCKNYICNNSLCAFLNEDGK